MSEKIEEKNGEKKSSIDPSIDNDLNNIESNLEGGSAGPDGDFIPSNEPTQKRQDTGLGSMVVMVVAMLCDKMAAGTGIEELALTKPESDGLTEAIEDVAELYELGGNPWVGLGLMTGAVTIPRYMLLKSFKDEIAKQKKAKKGADNGDQSPD
jgi:hypothetical protein